MDNLIIKAAQLAAGWHAGTYRKYNGKPYIVHPIRVANAVILSDIASETTVAAAYLHDVVEDCDVSTEQIVYRFNYDICVLVTELTNNSKYCLPKGSSRAERKAFDLKRISTVSREAKIIKIFDRIDNLNDFPLDNDEATKFLKRVYLGESYQLYQVVKDADKELASTLLDTINEVSRQIGADNYERSDC